MGICIPKSKVIRQSSIIGNGKSDKNNVGILTHSAAFMIDHNLVCVAMVSFYVVVVDNKIPFHQCRFRVIEFDVKAVFERDRTPRTYFH